MNACPQCDAENEPGVVVCVECGEPMTADATEPDADDAPGKPAAASKTPPVDMTSYSRPADGEQRAVDGSAWDGGAAMSAAAGSSDPAAAFAAICAGRRDGAPSLESSWALPHHKASGDAPNSAGVRNALSRLPQTKGLTNHDAAQAHLDAHMAAITASEKKSSRPPRDNLVRAMSRPPELRASESGSLPTMTGHFAVFNRWTHIDSMWEGSFMERIAPGAFKKTIAESKDSMRALFQHGQDPQVGDKPMGPIAVLREDSIGPYYEVPLLDTSYNRDILPGLEANLYGASFRFRVMKETFDQFPKRSVENPDGIPERTVQEAQVLEFGPVTFPAYAEATAGVRSDSLRSLTDAFVLGEMARDPERLRTIMATVTTRTSDETDLDEGERPVTEPSEPKAGESQESDDALQDEGAGDTHSDDGSRGQDQEDKTTVARKETSAMTAPVKSIEERRTRAEEIKTRFQEIQAEFGASVLSDEARAEWSTLATEQEENRKAIVDYEARQAFLSRVAESDANREPTYGAPAIRGRKKGVPDNVFAIEEYRQVNGGVDELRQGYRDGAMAVLERTTPAHPKVKPDAARGQVASLLAKDDENSTLARRIITTGSPLYSRAFGKTLKGMPLNSEEQRALSLGSDGDGGFAVPFQLDPTIILTSDGVINPLRSISRIESIVGKEWQGVTSTGITVTRTTEANEATDDSFALLQPTVRANRVQGFIPFSVELGQDWGALQSEVARLLADAKDVEESDSFVSGDGNDPNAGGILGSLDNGSYVPTVASNAFAIGDLYALEEALPPRFRARAQFLANRATYNRIRQFDVYGGAALWVRLLDGLGNELIGYPAKEASSIDGTLVDSKLIIAFGDFSQFLIVDRLGMSVELIPHLFGTSGRPTGQRGIYAIWRNNSKILVDNAFRALQVTP